MPDFLPITSYLDPDRCCHCATVCAVVSCRAIGGLLGNLKSGRGIFGEEATQKYARMALETVEEQVLEVAKEIREEEGATKVKKSDKTTKTASPTKPAYSKEDKWDVIMTGSGGEPLEVSVRPTSQVRLLLKAWSAARSLSLCARARALVLPEDEHARTHTDTLLHKPFFSSCSPQGCRERG